MRARHLLGLLAVVLSGCGTPLPQRQVAEGTGEAGATSLARLGDLAEPRASHTATLLADGTVLIAGGFRKGADGESQLYSRTAEIYDPARRSFRATGPMIGARCGHSATLLPDGKVLLAGGFDDAGLVASAEVYDPATGRFVATGAMTTARGGFTATALTDGSVLFTGGADRGVSLASSEVYRPALGSFVAGPSMRRARMAHTATALADGRVLIVGGAAARDVITATAEVYGADEFRGVGEMTVPRYKHAAILLGDGQVLVVGGSDERDAGGKYASAELFVPGSGSFVRTADLHNERFKLADSLATLTDGRVLIGGGSVELERYDPSTRSFGAVGRLEGANYFATATALPAGEALIVGGYDDRLRASAGAWLFAG